jgi:F-type H+-transporting ATPase subunit epsilon
MEIRIIMPDGIFYEGQADFIEFTSVNGQMGVYENHIPLTTILEPCVVKLRGGATEKKAAVLGGVVEIQKHKITMLAEDANWPEEIDLERAKAAKERAEARLRRKESGIDIDRAEVALKRAMARILATKN